MCVQGTYFMPALHKSVGLGHPIKQKSGHAHVYAVLWRHFAPANLSRCPIFIKNVWLCIRLMRPWLLFLFIMLCIDRLHIVIWKSIWTYISIDHCLDTCAYSMSPSPSFLFSSLFSQCLLATYSTVLSVWFTCTVDDLNDLTLIQRCIWFSSFKINKHLPLLDYTNKSFILAEDKEPSQLWVIYLMLDLCL